MEGPLKDTGNQDEINNLRHDVRNQLSSIQMAIEQLRYEVPDNSGDIAFYLDTIASSCTIINTLLKGKQ
jgi:signal transduction histidine kinase